MQMDRRSLMAVAGGGAVASTLAGALGASGTALAARTRRTPLDLTTVAGRLRAFMLMRGALDDRVIVSWMSARYYGVVDDRMDPMFAVVSAVFSRFRPRDGGWEAVNAEIAWFTDPQTDKVLDTYHNPYTGEDVTVPGGGFAPSKVRFGSDLSLHLDKDIPGLTMDHEVLPFAVRGDDVWVTERSRTAMTFPGASRPFRYSESNTFHASKAAMEAPGVTRVPVQVSFVNVCSWRPWLKMGDRPGHLTATGMGGHDATLAQLPPAWVEATSARRPELLKDPAAILAPLWDAKD